MDDLFDLSERQMAQMLSHLPLSHEGLRHRRPPATKFSLKPGAPERANVFQAKLRGIPKLSHLCGESGFNLSGQLCPETD